MQQRRRGWLARYGSVGLLTRFGLLTLVPVAVLGVALSQLLSASISQRAYNNAQQGGQLVADLGVQPQISADDLASGVPPDRLDGIDAALRSSGGGGVTGVVVWNRQHVVVYSEQRSQIGTTSNPGGGVAAALQGGTEVMVGPNDPAGTGPSLVQVFVPLRSRAGGPPQGAVEVLTPEAPIQAEIDNDTHRLFGVMIAGLLLLYAVMFPIVNASYRARIGAMENEAQALREHYLAQEALRGSEAKSKFLASMSHELRTPLNSILGFAQLLLEQSFGPLNERQRRYVGHINSSGQHLLSLINDILDLSKVQAGQMDLSVEDVNVRSAVEDVIARARPLAEAKQLDLELLDGPDVLVRADRRRLEQVLWNLLSNAIKFTLDGAVTVSVTTTRTQARIAVTDTGLGIAADEQSRIFEEFTQVQGVIGGGQDGTGLGLALTRRLVELMGGLIGVESVPNEGSTFTVTVPLSTATRRAVAPTAASRAV